MSHTKAIEAPRAMVSNGKFQTNRVYSEVECLLWNLAGSGEELAHHRPYLNVPVMGRNNMADRLGMCYQPEPVVLLTVYLNVSGWRCHKVVSLVQNVIKVSLL